MASFTTPANGDDALAEHIAQLTEDFSGLRNIPIALTGVNDASAYAQTIKNVGTGAKALIIYAANGTTVLLQVDANGVHASPDGSTAAAAVAIQPVTAAQLGTGAVGTTQLAANAVTQVGFSKGLTSSPTTTSTTYVTLDGDGSSNELRVDLTTTGGDLLCWLAASLFNSTAGQTVSVALSLDAGTEVGDQEMVAPSSNYREQMSTVWRFTGVSAAAHVVRARWKVGANTGTAQSTFRNLLVMEVKR